jgi:hypothetical protein
LASGTEIGIWVRLTTSTVQQEIVGPKGTDKGADYYKQDVYELDENLFPAGPYFNARAAHTEEEIVVGASLHPKRKEAGFTLAGDTRILKGTVA